MDGLRDFPSSSKSKNKTCDLPSKINKDALILKFWSAPISNDCCHIMAVNRPYLYYYTVK